MKKRSKRYKKLVKENKDKKSGTLVEAIDFVKKTSSAKFDESVDAFFKINVKEGKGETSLRTIVKLPHGNGKKIKVAVICEDGKSSEAKDSGADSFGSDTLIDKINSGKIDFDKLISTPAMMAKVGKLGKILGPKGLMPNPKLGTVTNDIKSSVKLLKTGQIEIKNDKDGNIGASIGKKSFSNDKINDNYNIILKTILNSKPSGIKGNFILSSYLSSTMGISYRVKIKGVQA
tara:strand:+ start:327 stop:1022 length:696 start_codon:yes stop_codon:yes gene_type:complete